jgi:hypothetical protein
LDLYDVITQKITVLILTTVWTRVAQISGTRSPRQLNFVWWCLIFVGLHCETCFLSWQLEF